MFEAQRFMDQLRGEVPELNPLESALAAGWVQDRRDQVTADKAAAEKQADLEARLEAQAFAERQFGSRPLNYAAARLRWAKPKPPLLS